jgi:hypothetical protein
LTSAAGRPVAAWLAGALAAVLHASACASGDPGSRDPTRTDPTGVAAEFRGCDAAGWCRFHIGSRDPLLELPRVRPEGVPGARGNDELAVAVRDRLNALLSSMIHQHKRIRLYSLHELDDGTYAATIAVNEADVASDPALRELLGN